MKKQHVFSGRSMSRIRDMEQGCSSFPHFLISHLLCFRIILFLPLPHSHQIWNPSFISVPCSLSLHDPYPDPKLQLPSSGGKEHWGWFTHSTVSPFGGGSVTPAGPAQRLWLTYLIGEMTSLEQTSLEQTFWRCLPDTLQQKGTVPPSRATQLALENAAWPHSIMPLTLKPNSSLITLFFPQSWMFTGSKYEVLKHCCTSFPTH